MHTLISHPQPRSRRIVTSQNYLLVYKIRISTHKSWCNILTKWILLNSIPSKLHLSYRHSYEQDNLIESCPVLEAPKKTLSMQLCPVLHQWHNFMPADWSSRLMRCRYYLWPLSWHSWHPLLCDTESPEVVMTLMTQTVMWCGRLLRTATIVSATQPAAAVITLIMDR